MPQLKGKIVAIKYKAEENDFKIAVLKTKEQQMTIQGVLPFVEIGDQLICDGEYVFHNSYGKQFKVKSFEKKMPAGEQALIDFISTLVVGIGEKKASKIVEKFGDETINIIKNDCERLTEVKGIKDIKAQELSEAFIYKWYLWESINFLRKFDISAENAKKIYEYFNSKTLEVIKKDPYIIDDIDVKISFEQLDRMAEVLGITKDSLSRINSGIIHNLRMIVYEGNTCVLKEKLITYVVEMLDIDTKTVLNGIKDLIAKKRIVVEKREDNSEWIYLKNLYDAENNIVYRLNKIIKNKKKVKVKNIEEYIETDNLELSEKQKEAVKLVNKNNVTIITGGPGTGKTTIIKTIIKMYRDLNKKIILCAPTGRAAKRMSEATGKKARTIHRVLEIQKYDDKEPDIEMEIKAIDADIVIIDEMSMVDVYLMNFLLNGLYTNTKLILVGDSNQLSSVGAGAVLKDFIQSGQIPYIELKEIFRQAEQSEIIINAHKVNKGINFLEDRENDIDILNDFTFIEENNTGEILHKIISFYKEDTQIISPTKKGVLGTENINSVIQENFNSKNQGKEEKSYGKIIFREGDKVMQIKNNYDIEWHINYETTNDKGHGIFNGEMGEILEIQNDFKRIVVKFDDGKEAFYEYDILDQLIHSYAITVHKSQGSEFENVIIPIMLMNEKLLTRNILYTAMTRAKSNLIIIGNRNLLKYMIDNIQEEQRDTGLEYKLLNIGAQNGN